MNHWDAYEAAGLSQDELSRSGLKIRMVDDHTAIPQIASDMGKPYLSPLLDPRLNDFTSGNCFWLVGEKEGQPVMIGGCRIDCMIGGASKVIASQLSRAYSTSVSLGEASRIDSAINGRVAYFGDLYSSVRAGIRGRRYFLAVAHYFASSVMRADCTYSFMRKADILRGGADTNGFFSRISQPILWGETPGSRSPTEEIAYRDKAENDDYFRSIIRELAGNTQQ